MSPQVLFLVIVLSGLLLYFAGFKKSLAANGGSKRTLLSRPEYHGLYLAFIASVPAIIIFCAINLSADYFMAAPIAKVVKEQGATTVEQESDFKTLQRVKESVVTDDSHHVDLQLAPAVQEYQRLKMVSEYALYLATLTALLGFAAYGASRIKKDFNARESFEKIAQWIFLAASFVSVLFTFSIVLSLFFEAQKFFHLVPLTDFLFGTKWSPQQAMRADQAGSSGAFGMIPLFVGTLLITLIAMLVAVPLGLLSAVYMSEYAKPKTRAIFKPLLELLAGIPTVVYGYFAVVVLAPYLKGMGDNIGVPISTESALVAGIVMGVMIIPFISSLSDDVINSVPQSLRDGSLAMGATPSETIRQVIMPAALPGIMGAVLLAVSRAIGETMIVVMAAGLVATLTINPLESVTTITVQIVNLLVGDQEFDSPKTLSAFALGLTLFVATLLLNYAALNIVRKYREQYD